MPTTIRLHPKTEKRIDELAVLSGRTRSFHIREMIESSIDNFEAACRADPTLERVRKGEEKIHTLEDAKNKLGLID
jgi:RHH-type transcriptional regulator, rel operon repressor / antitoxin RelB